MATKASLRQSRYDSTHCRTYGLKLNLVTDKDIIEKLSTVSSMQGYIKQLVREDIARTCSKQFEEEREDKTMKTYIVKPDCLYLFGEETTAMTVFSEEDIERLAADWGKPIDEVKEQLIEIKPSAYRAIHRFEGTPGWQKLNELIRFDSGCEEDFFETEEDYKQAVREGFVKYDGYYTTIYVDD